METLRGLVNLARLSPSAANLQPLKYVLRCELKTNDEIFRHLKWAGYLKEWTGPAEGERPAAYIVILGDTKISGSIDCDHGIAAQTIMLGAAEMGLGGCIIGSVDRKALSTSLGLLEQYEILLVLALGKPKERVEITEIEQGGEVRYYRDNVGMHHVPKRKLDDLIVAEHDATTKETKRR